MILLSARPSPRTFISYTLLIMTAIAFFSAPYWVNYLVPDVGNLTPDDATHVKKLCGLPVAWFRAFGMLALGSTIVWSIVGLFTVYDDDFFDHSKTIGSHIYKITLGLAILSLLACGLGIWAVWSGAVYPHLVCVTTAEATFWLFDFVLIRRLRTLWNEDKIRLDDENDAEGKWSKTLATRLHSWIRYIDRPATIAFILLYVCVRYLDKHGIFYDKFDREFFATGAVFFALMTANLSFFAANLPEFVPRKRAKATS